MFLREATNKLLAERKFKEFSRPVDPEEVYVEDNPLIKMLIGEGILTLAVGKYEEVVRFIEMSSAGGLICQLSYTYVHTTIAIPSHHHHSSQYCSKHESLHILYRTLALQARTLDSNSGFFVMCILIDLWQVPDLYFVDPTYG